MWWEAWGDVQHYVLGRFGCACVCVCVLGVLGEIAGGNKDIDILHGQLDIVVLCVCVLAHFGARTPRPIA